MIQGKDILEELKHLVDDPAYSRFFEINRAYRYICRLTAWNWLRRQSDTLIVFSASTSDYSLNMASMRSLVSIHTKGGTDDRWRLLEETPVSLFEVRKREHQDANGTDRTAKPLYYKLMGFGASATISVLPKPDQTYSVRVTYILRTPEIEAEKEVLLPPEYASTIALLAASYLLERHADPLKQQIAARYKEDALEELQSMLKNTHPNRTVDLDRKPVNWIY